MKYSQPIGILAAILIIAMCYLPWSTVPGEHIVIKGMEAAHTDFGRPGLLNIVLCCIMIVLFVLPKLWAKRTNLFIAVMNFAWSIRNYILVTSCLSGECPEKQPALFGLMLFGLIALLMSFLPKMDLTKA